MCLCGCGCACFLVLLCVRVWGCAVSRTLCVYVCLNICVCVCVCIAVGVTYAISRSLRVGRRIDQWILRSLQNVPRRPRGSCARGRIWRHRPPEVDGVASHPSCGHAPGVQTVCRNLRYIYIYSAHTLAHTKPFGRQFSGKHIYI